MVPGADNSHLRELVKDHGVAFELHPAFSLPSGKRVQVGFDLELYGAHDGEHGPKKGEVACEGCAQVWDHLREIAAEVVAADGNGDGIYRVDPFRPGVTVATRRKGADGQNREDVELVLEIRSRGEHVEDLDPCEEKCVKPLVESLRELGAREGA